MLQDIQSALEATGVAHISCNPITANNAAKALLRVAEAEQMPLSKKQAQSIAEAASGDLRNAMEMLQLLALGHSPAEAVSTPRKVTAAHFCCEVVQGSPYGQHGLHWCLVSTC